MYDPWVIDKRRAQAEEAYGLALQEYSIQDCSDWADRLADAQDEDGNPTRALSPEEQAFIQNELLMSKVSFPYWAQRYAFINIEGRGVDRLFPLLDSQKFILARMGDLEKKAMEGGRADGILVNILKATRQIGVSTLSECLAAHRMTTQNNIFGLLASDVPGSSAFLFDMFERVLDKLPWWMKPAEKFHEKNSEVIFDGGSSIWVAAGKSTRGTTGQRGQIGRGKTLSVVHLSELSTWEAPSQIDSALLPTVHRNPRVLVIFESTAKGRGNWWHQHWKYCREAKSSRFLNIFIPWYAEPRYSVDPPSDWQPREATLIHAKACEETSERWTGRLITPTPAQLYWYESTRDYYEGKDNLREFMEEYGSIDDDECFQHSGHSIFGPKILARHQEIMKPILGQLEVMPMKELR